MSDKAPKELLQAQRMANMLDTAFTLPLVNMKIGLDSIIGLIPGVGDPLMFLVSMRIVHLGKKLGLPKPLIYKMLRNALVDLGLGFLPIIGDVIDLFFRANVRNVRIMEQWWVSQNKAGIDSATQKKLAKWSQDLEQLEQQKP